MYVENKDGLLEDHSAWIGWVTFSRTGRSVYYKGRNLRAIGGKGIRGNFIDEDTGEEYWVSGVKRRGSNTHPVAGGAKPMIDEDAKDAYAKLKRGV